MEADDTLTYDELHADLIAASTSTLPERYFTTSEFADDVKVGFSAARRRLVKRIEAGELEEKRVLIDGHWTHIYWFTGKRISKPD